MRVSFVKLLYLPLLFRVVLIGVVLAPGTALSREEAVVVLRSKVTGNQEQPKVLYIVPWQQPDGPGSLYRPLQSLVDEVFEPVERREFVRELNYREQVLQRRRKDYE